MYYDDLTPYTYDSFAQPGMLNGGARAGDTHLLS
jgi:hypothetical protein